MAAAESAQESAGTYVYGIFPGDIELADDQTGVGDPPGQVRVVHSGDLAALVSDVDPDHALGTPDDLTAHKRILDDSAAEVPVLPLRFGAVLASEDAVANELLAAHHDEFASALDELEGKAEYVVKGRYVENIILAEVLSENKQAMQLAERIRSASPDATRDARIELGELISNAITAKREQDTRELGDRMDGHCVASLVREPTHERDAVHVAFLIDTEAGQDKDLEEAIDELAGTWEGRIDLRVLGPMAAYDFVGTADAGT